MSTVVNQIRRSFYLDSVALMRLSVKLAGMPGIEDASLMIGTDANKQIMKDANLLEAASCDAGPNDLIIALRGTSAEVKQAADAALAMLDTSNSPEAAANDWQPRSVNSAIQQLPGANLALISVPGEFAIREAHNALKQGLHVMIFSDNVPVTAERALKEYARAQDLLVMGPDCGTALLGGQPLAFANEVSRGSIGIVAASGTGLQELSVLVSRGGGGISHGIGTGGRDLSDEVGGITTLSAIDALEADEDTRHIVVISKPPGPATAELVNERLSRCRKPVTLCLVGHGLQELPESIQAVATLKEAAEVALGNKPLFDDFDTAQHASAISARMQPGRRWLRALYSGGTLCAEAQVLMQNHGLDICSNAPVPGVSSVRSSDADVHMLLDLGADEYTIGRPHPMIEPAVRNDVLAQQLDRSDIGVVLLDVVLGYGAHTDPAGAVAVTLHAKGNERPAVIASVCGTENDPQGYSAQVRTLENAGVLVAPSNAQAAELAASIVAGFK